MSVTTVQIRIGAAKKMQRVVGPDDADLVIELDSANLGLDPTVAYMQGKLKVTGSTGKLLDELSSGRMAAALAGL